MPMVSSTPSPGSIICFDTNANPVYTFIQTKRIHTYHKCLQAVVGGEKSGAIKR